MMNNKRSNSDDEDSNNNKNPMHHVAFTDKKQRRSSRLNAISSAKENSSSKHTRKNEQKNISKAGPSSAIDEGPIIAISSTKENSSKQKLKNEHKQISEAGLSSAIDEDPRIAISSTKEKFSSKQNPNNERIQVSESGPLSAIDESPRIAISPTKENSSSKQKPNNEHEQFSKAGPSSAIDECPRIEYAFDSDDAGSVSSDDYVALSECTCCSAGPSQSSCVPEDSSESNVTKTDRKRRKNLEKAALELLLLDPNNELNNSLWLETKRNNYRKQIKRKINTLFTPSKSNASSSDESSDSESALLNTVYRYDPVEILVPVKPSSSEDSMSSSDESHNPNTSKYMKKLIRQLEIFGEERIREELGKKTYSVVPENRESNSAIFSPEEIAELNEDIDIFDSEGNDIFDSEGRVKINYDNCDFQRFVMEELPNIPSDEDDDISDTVGFKQWEAKVDEKFDELQKKHLAAMKKRERKNLKCKKKHREHPSVIEMSVDPVQSEKITDQFEKEIEDDKLKSHEASKSWNEQKNDENRPVKQSETNDISVHDSDYTSEKKQDDDDDDDDRRNEQSESSVKSISSATQRKRKQE